jgi:hypothetical protein
MKLACVTGLYQLDGVLEGCRPVKSVPKGFTDQRVERCVIPTLASMDLCEQFTTVLPGNTLLSEEKKAKEQLLKSAWMALAKRDFSSLAVISSMVAHAMALVKNHMPEFDADILRRDFSINEVEQETLVHSVYDTTQHFVSLYDFSALTESNDNNSLDAL